MDIQLIPYNSGHASDILSSGNVRECDAWISDSPDWQMWANGWEANGPAFTLVIDDQVVACAGVVLMGYNRGEAWTLFTPLINKYPKACFKAIRDGLEAIIQDHSLKRVQALVRPDYEAAEQFLKHLGFEREGLLKAFAPDNSDMIIYGRTN